MPFDFSAANETAVDETSVAPAPSQDPRTTEDCLFLDVIVPKSTLDSARILDSSQCLVFVWIHGGEYCSGDKTSYGNGAGLVKVAQTINSSGVIVVLLNYRVGDHALVSIARYLLH